MEIIVPRKLALALIIFIFTTLYLIFALNSCLSENLSYVIPRVRIRYFVWEALLVDIIALFSLMNTTMQIKDDTMCVLFE